ncbi:unnamed protein product [Vicia faba]|uniref:Uncharacterized protein n=1 Tax=Vicia faba TaxID=3906 RepID=A0AAV0ZLT8_VICFA|nr:unnamed protein product [Vicia faba]
MSRTTPLIFFIMSSYLTNLRTLSPHHCFLSTFVHSQTLPFRFLKSLPEPIIEIAKLHRVMDFKCLKLHRKGVCSNYLPESVRTSSNVSNVTRNLETQRFSCAYAESDVDDRTLCREVNVDD